MKLTTTQKIERWAENELMRNIKHVIIDDDTGSYVAFGKYYLESVDAGCQVSTWDRHIHTFANRRTAISWCVADKYHQYTLANNIQTLDSKKQQIADDLYCRRTQAQLGRNETFYETVITKLQPKEILLNSVKNELEKCINLAKYLQLRGFSNETA